MTKTRTILGTLVLGLALASGPATAVAAQTDEAEPSAGAWAWKGPKQGAGELPNDVPSARRWLANLRVQAKAGRLPEGFEAELDSYWVMATGVDQRQLLVDVALTRSDVLECQGKIVEALQATEDLLFPTGHPIVEADPARFYPASPELLESATQWAGDARLRHRRAYLQSLLAPREQDLGDLEATLRANIEAGNFQLVNEIGARAVPALEAAVLADLKGFPQHVGNDPLLYYMRLAERRAATVLLEHAPAAGYPLRKRILRAMTELRILQEEEYWGGRPAHDQPVTCLTPEWTSVLALLIRDPDTAREAMGRVWMAIDNDGLTAEMCASLGAAFDSGNPDLVHDVLQMLGRVPGRRYSVKPLLEHLLGSEDPDVRRFAASKLLVFPENAALAERYGDEDPGVREAVARSLEKRYITGVGDVHPAIGEPERELIHLLLQDDDDGVRNLAARALLDLDTPADEETYLKVLRDEDPRIRRQLAWLRHPDDELVSDILLALSRDPDASVLESIDSRLDNEEVLSRPGPFLAAARARLLDTVHPMGEPGDLIRHLANSEEGVLTLIDCALRYPDDSLLRRIWDWSGHFVSSTGTGNWAVLAIDDADLAGLFVALHRSHGSGFGQLTNVLRSDRTQRWSAMLLVLADASAPIDARLQAALHSAQGGGESFAAAFLDLLSAPVWQAREPSDAELEIVSGIVDEIPSRERNALILKLLRTATAPDSIAELVAGFYAPEDPLGREITLEVLKRWFRPDGSTYRPVSKALFHLRTLRDDVVPETLMQAVRNPAYAIAAIGTMGALRDERYLPALESALTADWVYDDSDRYSVQLAAISALSGFMSDEAAEVLLRGMSTATTRSVRDACRSALAALRTNEEERRRWLEHKEGRLEREDAIQRVLVLLRDDDALIRAEAARALGTLGAVETLPVLIEMLRDGDEGVKEAVREALARLNEPRGD